MTKYLYVLLLLLLISCTDKEEFKLDYWEGAKSVNSSTLDSLSINYCNGNIYEFTNLHELTSKIQEDSLEEIIIVDYLQNQGYDYLNFRRGNWEKGPRAVNVTLANSNCRCDVTKLYYSTNIAGQYKVTEKIQCKEIDKATILKESFPDNLEVMDSLEFDLNGDDIKDKIYALKPKNKDPNSEEIRPLLIYLSNNSSWIKIQNNNILLPVSGGGIFGDPYDGIEIESNNLIIRHYGGSSWRWGLNLYMNYDPIDSTIKINSFVKSSCWTLNVDSTMVIDTVNYIDSNINLTNFEYPDY